MKNIFINGLKSRAGGGKNIFDNYLRLLSQNSLDDYYYVLTPDKNEYAKYSTKNITIVDVKSIFKSNLLFPLLYFYELPILLKSLKIDLVFNFGDVIVPTKRRQVYFFDWAYAVYPDRFIWKRMTGKDYLMRKTKVILIKKYIQGVELTIAQNENMSRRLRNHFNITKISVIPTPVGLAQQVGSRSLNFDFPKDKKKLLFPASFSSHKNFDILLPVAELIERHQLPYLIIVTLAEKESLRLMGKVEKQGLESILNVGRILSGDMPLLYQQCDALFFPSLLESFGLPYVEAMTYGKPIITSDLDFAHEVCGDAAHYFDPFDPNSILNAIRKVFSDPVNAEEKVEVGKVRVKKLPEWNEVFSRFQQEIKLLIN